MGTVSRWELRVYAALLHAGMPAPPGTTTTLDPAWPSGRRRQSSSSSRASMPATSFLLRSSETRQNAASFWHAGVMVNHVD